MALSRLTSWVANQILTRNALVAEFDNLYNNGLALISPLTGNLNAGLRQITNLLLETQSATQSAGNEGRVYYQTGLDAIHVDDGSNIRHVPSLVDPNADRIVFWDDSAGTHANLTASTGLTISGTTLTAHLGSGTPSDVAASRALNTSYQNASTTNYLLVQCNIVHSGATTSFQLGIATAPTAVASKFQNTAAVTADATHTVLVPPQWYYRVQGASITANQWWEMTV